MSSASHAWQSLPLPDWPRRDRQAWEAAITKGGLLDPGGHASTLSHDTLKAMRQIYGALLGWLLARGDLDPEAGPADRLTHERFLGYLAARRAAVSDNVTFNSLRMLAMTMNCLAPGSEWGWLYRHPQAPRRCEASAARRPVPIVQPGVMMAGLLTRLHAMQAAPPSESTARRLRDLLLVAVCIATALRRRNLLALTLGKTILRHPSGYEIRFGAGGLKNQRAVTIWLMAELTPFLDLYIGTHRAHLLRPGDDAGGVLWVSREGNRLAAPTLNMIFTCITREVQGRPANPQSFRHSAVTALLRDDPRSMDVASALLAHHDDTNTGRFYDLSGDDAARAKWQSLIAKYRPMRRAGSPQDPLPHRPPRKRGNKS